MHTPRRHPLWAMFVLLTALLWLTARTTPGLMLITVGSLAAWRGHPWSGLALAAIGAMVYAQQCSRTPYAPCLWCKGTGHRRHRRTRACRPCRGKGVRIRWGRAVMNAYRRATYTAPTAPAAHAARPLTPTTYDQALTHTDRRQRRDQPMTHHPARTGPGTRPVVHYQPMPAPLTPTERAELAAYARYAAQVAARREQDRILHARWKARQAAIGERDRRTRKVLLGLGITVGVGILAGLTAAGWLIWHAITGIDWILVVTARPGPARRARRGRSPLRHRRAALALKAATG